MCPAVAGASFPGVAPIASPSCICTFLGTCITAQMYPQQHAGRLADLYDRRARFRLPSIFQSVTTRSRQAVPLPNPQLGKRQHASLPAGAGRSSEATYGRLHPPENSAEVNPEFQLWTTEPHRPSRLPKRRGRCAPPWNSETSRSRRLMRSGEVRSPSYICPRTSKPDAARIRPEVFALYTFPIGCQKQIYDELDSSHVILRLSRSLDWRGLQADCRGQHPPGVYLSG